jgi:hypothetical protein
MEIYDEDLVDESYNKMREASDKLLKTWTIKDAIEEWKKNNEFIDKHHENLLSADVQVMMKINHKIITDISYVATFPMQFKF